LDTEQGIGSNQTLTVERRVAGHETSKVSVPMTCQGSRSHTADEFDSSVVLFEDADVSRLIIHEIDGAEESKEVYKED
jgi:hypothetical protein